LTAVGIARGDARLIGVVALAASTRVLLLVLEQRELHAARRQPQVDLAAPQPVSPIRPGRARAPQLELIVRDESFEVEQVQGVARWRHMTTIQFIWNMIL
jgi:hypothetical protein